MIQDFWLIGIWGVLKMGDPQVTMVVSILSHGPMTTGWLRVTPMALATSTSSIVWVNSAHLLVKAGKQKPRRRPPFEEYWCFGWTEPRNPRNIRGFCGSWDMWIWGFWGFDCCPVTIEDNKKPREKIPFTVVFFDLTPPFIKFMVDFPTFSYDFPYWDLHFW